MYRYSTHSSYKNNSLVMFHSTIRLLEIQLAIIILEELIAYEDVKPSDSAENGGKMSVFYYTCLQYVFL